jgi:biopolymer transport protein ExbB
MAQVLAVIVKGGIVMIPLLICSLISLALTIERILFWAKLKSREVLREILTHVEQGEFDQALKLGKTSQQPIARVMAAGIAHRNPAPAKAMEAAAQAEIPVLKRRLGVLDTIVTLAPLLGLLGTVVGSWPMWESGNLTPLPAASPKL